MNFKHLFISMTSMLILSSISAFSQGFTPTDKWPYVYEDFQNATLINVDGKGDQKALVNICVADDHIHYVRTKDEVILDLLSLNLKEIKIQDKVYTVVGSQVLEKVLENEYGSILKGKRINYDEMNKVDIGYGISTNNYSASNLDMTQVLIPGSLNQRVRNAMEAREYEQSLEVEDVLYLYDGEQLIKATKSDFIDAYGKKETAEFLKQNKIKWGKPESMIKAIEFMKSAK